MRILIADKLHPTGIDALRNQGHTCTLSPELKDASLAEAMGDHEVLVVRSTKVTAAIIDAASSLRLIIRAGAGTNTIDMKHASAKGIYVANCPGQNAVAVAELTLGLAVAADRGIAAADAALKAGRWEKKRFSGGRGLAGRRWGVAGFGAIGKAVARRARAMDMKVGAWSRRLSPSQAERHGVEAHSSLAALASQSDVLSIHLPLNEETRGCVGPDIFESLPAGTLLINASREGIVDEAALLPHLESGRLRYATDVFDGEPSAGEGEFNHPLAAHPQVVSTPHIGAATEQAQEAVSLSVARIVGRYDEAGEVVGCVNMLPHPASPWVLNVRHLNRVGVLASVLTEIRKAGINVEDVDNRLFEGAEAALAKIRLSAAPEQAVLEAVQAAPHIIDLHLFAGQAGAPEERA